MRIIIPVVLSADGKMSKGDNGNAHTWASKEDAQYFDRLRAEHWLLIMGRDTYETVRPKPEPDRLRVVLTSTPEAYTADAVPGQLEFVQSSPVELVRQLAARGYDEALLLGGRRVHSDFLVAGLIDELHITIEPVLFGSGLSLLADQLVDIPLRLAETMRLNSRGTLLLRYEVKK
ncbi:MAG TPA: dihydrofolate reductase family protein [Candidatus Saccharimonadales bacterium]|nr:dihydrofolate reductase family protein [Candidatus Saccharimonadales bacterium]